MRIRAFAPLVAVSAAVAFSGCGIVTKDLEGNVKFGFEINEQTDSSYENIVTFDPNSNQDVKDNRDKIEEGNILSIAILVSEVSNDNLAIFVGGQVDVRGQGEGENAWIMAVGQWSGIPLYDDTGRPATGVKFLIDLPIETQDELSNKVFLQTNPLDFRIHGQAFDAYLRPLAMGPVKFKGEVDVSLAVKISAP